MTDTLDIFGKRYTGVTGIIATDSNSDDLTYVNTSDANANQYALLEGATAYVNGVKITGVVPQMTQYTGDISQYFHTENNQRKWSVEGIIRTDQGGVVNPGASFGTGAFTFNAVPSNTVITPTTSSQTVGGANYMMEGPITINASTGTAKNVQIAQGINRVATTTYTAVSGQTLTVAKTGKYDVYWSGYRSSTGGTNGSQLYIDDTAYGTAQTTFSNNGQSVHLTNVSLTKDDVITVRARARGTSYYMYVANLTIVEA